jgi:uncharacterized protein
MSTTNAEPVTASERIGALDVVRGVAVCGILLMNIPMMGQVEDLYRPLLPARQTLDWIAYTTQDVGFAGSMRGLFTLLFGAGMMIMLRRDEGGGDSAPAQAFFTRCFALMLLGVAQFAIFLWPGEILFNYGVVGLALFLFRRAQVRVLLTAAAALLFTMSIALGSQSLSRGEMLRTGEAAAVAKAAGKTLSEEQTKALEARAETMKHVHPPKDVIAKEVERRTSFPGVLAWSTEVWAKFNLGPESPVFLAESLAFMLLGVALFRMNVLSGERPLAFYAWLAAGGYATGLAIRGFRSALQWGVGFEPTADIVSWGGFVYEVGRLPMTLGLLGLVLTLYKLGLFGALAGGLKAVGRLALTNYIGQSVITSILFYGLGYLGKIGFAGLMGVCVLVWIAQGVFSVLWLRRYEMGPAEWLLRALTYGRMQALERVRTPSAPAVAAAE